MAEQLDVPGGACWQLLHRARTHPHAGDRQSLWRRHLSLVAARKRSARNQGDSEHAGCRHLQQAEVCAMSQTLTPGSCGSACRWMVGGWHFCVPLTLLRHMGQVGWGADSTVLVQSLQKKCAQGSTVVSPVITVLHSIAVGEGTSGGCRGPQGTGPGCVSHHRPRHATNAQRSHPGGQWTRRASPADQALQAAVVVLLPLWLLLQWWLLLWLLRWRLLCRLLLVAQPCAGLCYLMGQEALVGGQVFTLVPQLGHRTPQLDHWLVGHAGRTCAVRGSKPDELWLAKNCAHGVQIDTIRGSRAGFGLQCYPPGTLPAAAAATCAATASCSLRATSTASPERGTG